MIIGDSHRAIHMVRAVVYMPWCRAAVDQVVAEPAVDGVLPGCIDNYPVDGLIRSWVRVCSFKGEVNMRPVAFSDPVPLHCKDLFGPALEPVRPLQQFLGPRYLGRRPWPVAGVDLAVAIQIVDAGAVDS